MIGISIFNQALLEKKKEMERFLAAWLVLSTIVCTWDAGFVLLRPRSMAGGDLEYIWKPYRLYVTIDVKYGDLKDDFIVAQSWANLVECVFNILAVILLYRSCFTGILVSYATCIMTFWKTVIYFMCSIHNEAGFSHVSWNNYVLLFIIPNGIWIVVPLAFIVSLTRRIYNNNNSIKNKYKTS